MKLFCLLISLFFVDVLADYGLYMELVHLTNEGIRRAYLKNDLTVGGRSGANGLEHLIETMIDDVNNVLNYQDFCKICFLMVVPDQRKILMRITEPPPHPLHKGNSFFDKMLQDLVTFVGVDMTGNYIAVRKTLKNLADKRRELVSWSLKNIISRRLLGSAQDVEDGASLLANCRLLGLYSSAQYPTDYINEVNIDLTSGTCTLTSCDFTQRMYRKIGGIWSQIDRNGQLQESLEAQIQRGRPQAQPTT
ncbi:uncharacterized protein LOC126840012 [Adelges cooleyi]|uniref:uncharacterized protein LOC126840012 n=1 Tax=Adelges cooleyi TaxID=133065 RepID=UPI00217F5A78|nr:uncharacterized protein LOC126840012 [Adelges cooleyi]XP_050431451.1 uncharacterized protein LOC126840012 [Adelges cooleyi]XP_050431452.1 uncharacterized protein LOC126840012 [Adelges cooleyi]XP_050431453.1 uncharacterized protein LOC126840012 [Adelges cooleyi]XP_050431454.1 uncharacterized protein LOC126840012 [Adelges cooleyi]